jgi:hypothetical protein
MAIDSFMESLRDFSRFVDRVCRTKRSPGFAWMNSIVTSVALTIDRLPTASAIDITNTIRFICTFQAEDISRSILAGAPLEAKTAVERISLQNFPFESPANQGFADNAVHRFETRCRTFSEGLLDEIPDKIASLRQTIRDQMQTEWQKQWTSRRLALLNQLSNEVTEIGQRLANEASNSAVNEVNSLTFQTALDCVSADPFSERAIATGLRELTIAAERLHPRCPILIADQFCVLKANIERNVRTAVSPHWTRKKKAAQEWKTSELDKVHQANLRAEAERHRQETLRLQEEARQQRIAEQAKFRARQAGCFRRVSSRKAKPLLSF